MKPREQVEAEFRQDLQALLDKYSAEMATIDKWDLYCYSGSIMMVTIPYIYDSDNCQQDFVEVDLGDYVSRND